MYGQSWQAQIQFSAASTGNPHLKAIFPAATWMDNYTGCIYPGGVYNKAFGGFFTWSQNFLNSNVITPIDPDADGKLLAEARTERRSATVGEKFTEVFRKFPFRDDVSPEGYKIWLDSMAHQPFRERINRSGIPIYMVAGWYDLFARDMFVLYANLSVPKRLLVRPVDHSQIDENQFDLDYGAEAHRWFDYWLKGVKNGIMDEPPIHYYLMGAPKKHAWQVTKDWPMKTQQITPLYFGTGETRGLASVNNGILNSWPPTAAKGSDTYVVDYTTTTGEKARWKAVNWAHKYPNMLSNDSKGLTYTTLPLETTVRVIGHPVVHLWLRSEAPDLDVFAYLEEVDGDGNSTYITEGNLRASHRSPAQAPYDNLGLPYQSHFQKDLKSIPAGEPFELTFDLLPTAYHFSKGKRIRLTIAFADADNFDTPRIDPVPKIDLLRDRKHPSSVQLPVVQ
jgi:putative CocE/NonD family hydrolase